MDWIDSADRVKLTPTNGARPHCLHAAPDYQDAMSLIDLANPSRFLALTARVLPWLAALTALLLRSACISRRSRPTITSRARP